MKMKTLSRSFRRDLVTYGMVVVMFLAIQLLSGMGLLTNSLSGQLVPICAYIIMAISLNLTVGILGELSLGHAGFAGIGAYACALSLLTHDAELTPLQIRHALGVHEEIMHVTVEIHRCDIC